MSTTQVQTYVHPRRRALKAALPTLSTSSTSELTWSSSLSHNPHLRRGSTFHSPTTPPSEDRDPILSIPSLPRRSPTCPATLEAFAAGEQRMAGILDKISLDLLSSSHPNSDTPAEDDLPVPRGILQARVGRRPFHMGSEQETATQSYGLLSPPMDPPRERQKSHRRQTSDSGLGSSIGSTTKTEQSMPIPIFFPPFCLS
jgi:hypothetical protein